MAIHVAGISRGSANWGNYFQWQKSFGQFLALIDDYKAKGYRLVDVETYLDKGQRKWAGIFRTANWDQQFVPPLDWPGFQKQMDALGQAKKPLLLFNLEIYNEGGKVLWAGIARSGLVPPGFVGTAITMAFGKLSKFQAAYQSNKAAGFRPVHIQTYVENGNRQWVGIFLPGDWESYLLADLDLDAFAKATQKEFDNNGIRLIDMVTYVDGGQRLWAGIGRKGTWANNFIVANTMKYFQQKTQELFDKEGRRLIKIALYEV